ncbi:hypothetical protein BJX99DRAFT_261437 [Aspergillus californicus]
MSPIQELYHKVRTAAHRLLEQNPQTSPEKLAGVHSLGWDYSVDEWTQTGFPEYIELPWHLPTIELSTPTSSIFHHDKKYSSMSESEKSDSKAHDPAKALQKCDNLISLLQNGVRQELLPHGERDEGSDTMRAYGYILCLPVLCQQLKMGLTVLDPLDKPLFEDKIMEAIIWALNEAMRVGNTEVTRHILDCILQLPCRLQRRVRVQAFKNLDQSRDRDIFVYILQQGKLELGQLNLVLQSIIKRRDEDWLTQVLTHLMVEKNRLVALNAEGPLSAWASKDLVISLESCLSACVVAEWGPMIERVLPLYLDCVKHYAWFWDRNEKHKAITDGVLDMPYDKCLGLFMTDVPAVMKTWEGKPSRRCDGALAGNWAYFLTDPLLRAYVVEDGSLNIPE